MEVHAMCETQTTPLAPKLVFIAFQSQYHWNEEEETHEYQMGNFFGSNLSLKVIA